MKKSFGLSIIPLCLLGSTFANADIVAANYFVPASKTACAPRATTFALTNASLVKNTDGSQTLSFSLPEDLVGSGVAPVVLTESAAPTVQTPQDASGVGVSAVCSATNPSQTNCLLSYLPNYLQVDPTAVKTFLTQKYGSDPALLAQKLTASGCFLQDPEGVFNFTVSK